ncbi:WD40 repeat-containing protein [Heterostelium album PN500]|uniref:WD40 repeat-containing protein n=1 Tax=Heterostelium pallidum (strain ATCC 26659 / Pp 5 / PN500) TaxID=670386 RepID=D3BGG5_HETP5|nr:WD40 repeat-containing protein [Heterostelium album PN500]EFA79565.1 WD40 repeat-containing protein [Heterostelium album PN500]|eukprot:XP_020431686.1 WD40 repeat-containing protein [Heterostelium album PN500]
MTTCGFNKSGSHFASISQDSIITVWNVAQNKITSTFTLEKQIKYSCFNWYSEQEGETTTLKLAAGLSNGHIKVYDLVEDKLSATLEDVHSCRISDLTFSGESLLYSIDIEGLVVQWNIDTAQKVSQFSDREAHRIAINPDHSTVATGGKRLRFWDVSSNSQSDQQKQFVNNTLFYIPASATVYSTTTTATNGNVNGKVTPVPNGDLLISSNRSFYHIRDLAKVNSVGNTYRSDSIPKHVSVLPYTDKYVTFYFCAIVTEANDIVIHKNTEKQTVSKTKLKFDPQVDLISCQHIDINTLLVAQGQRSSTKSVTFKKIKIGEKGEPINTPIEVEFETKDKSVINANKTKAVTSTLGDAAELNLDNEINTDLKSINNNAKSASTIVDIITQSLQSSNTKALLQAMYCNTFVMKNTVQALPSPYAYMLLQVIIRNISTEFHKSHMLMQWINFIIKEHASYLLTVPDLKSKMQILNTLVEDKYRLHETLTKLVGKFELIEARGNTKSVRSTNYDPSLVYEDNSDDESEDEEMEDDGENIDDVDLEDDSSEEEDDDNSDIDINPEDLMDEDLL